MASAVSSLCKADSAPSAKAPCDIETGYYLRLRVEDIRTATIVHGMQRTGGKYGMVTMCVGMGQGAAGIFERV